VSGWTEGEERRNPGKARQISLPKATIVEEALVSALDSKQGEGGGRPAVKPKEDTSMGDFVERVEASRD